MSFFDTLAYAKKLQQAGVTPEQAEVQAEALKDVIEGQAVTLATKQDLDQAVFMLHQDFERLADSTQQDGQRLEAKIDQTAAASKRDSEALTESTQQEFQRLDTKIDQLGEKTEADIARCANELRKEMAEMKVDIIKWNLASMVALAGLMLVILKLT